MQAVLDHLKAGLRRFQAETFPPNAEEYRRAGAGPQRPHTLMITCSDSRVDIETVTSSRPGELFILRNVGNLVPRYGETVSGVAAVVEYAVSALQVKHIVVCGHSDCGAMKALQHPESLHALPMVKNWLYHADAAVYAWQRSDLNHPQESLARLTEQNVLTQMEQLKTHPTVAAAMAGEGLGLSGWVYEIGSGQVRIANDGETVFTPVAREP